MAKGVATSSISFIDEKDIDEKVRAIMWAFENINGMGDEPKEIEMIGSIMKRTTRGTKEVTNNILQDALGH